MQTATGFPQVGEKVNVRSEVITSRNKSIRFDSSQGAAAESHCPKGASGSILAIGHDDILVELYWNPGGGQYGGHVWRVWVKKPSFGSIFDRYS